MPLGTILSKQAIHTLTQLHAELAGKIEGNRKKKGGVRRDGTSKPEYRFEILITVLGFYCAGAP
jgi:hypothetical protein